jgi:hypothetical protein
MSSLLLTGSPYLPPIPNLSTTRNVAELNAARPLSINSGAPAVSPTVASNAIDPPAKVPPANMLAYKPDFSLLKQQILKGGSEGARALQELASLLKRGVPGAAGALKDLIVIGFKTFGRNTAELTRFLVPIVQSFGKGAVLRAIQAAAASLGGISVATLTTALGGAVALIGGTAEGLSNGTLPKRKEKVTLPPEPEAEIQRKPGKTNTITPWRPFERSNNDLKKVRDAVSGKLDFGASANDRCSGSMHVQLKRSDNDKNIEAKITLTVTAESWDPARGSFRANPTAIAYGMIAGKIENGITGVFIVDNKPYLLRDVTTLPKVSGYKNGQVIIVAKANVSPVSAKNLVARDPPISGSDGFGRDSYVPESDLDYSLISSSTTTMKVDTRQRARDTGCVFKKPMDPKNSVVEPAQFRNLNRLPRQTVRVDLPTLLSRDGQPQQNFPTNVRVGPTPP